MQWRNKASVFREWSNRALAGPQPWLGLSHRRAGRGGKGKRNEKTELAQVRQPSEKTEVGTEEATGSPGQRSLNYRQRNFQPNVTDSKYLSSYP